MSIIKKWRDLKNMQFIKILIIGILIQALNGQVWQPDLDNGSYKNPIIWADYSDPDVIRVGQDFYMTASSFNCVPALPILHSTDLVNCQIIQSHFLETGHIFLRMIYSKDGKCQFFYSTDDKNYKLIGKVFHVREGKWIGAKVGLFALAAKETGTKGYADFDWFRIK